MPRGSCKNALQRLVGITRKIKRKGRTRNRIYCDLVVEQIFSDGASSFLETGLTPSGERMQSSARSEGRSDSGITGYMTKTSFSLLDSKSNRKAFGISMYLFWGKIFYCRELQHFEKVVDKRYSGAIQYDQVEKLSTHKIRQDVFRKEDVLPSPTKIRYLLISCQQVFYS